MGIFARRTPFSPAKGAEGTHGKDVWLDNDDLRPLKLADRTWNIWTYSTFWFSAAATVSSWYVVELFISNSQLIYVPGMAHLLLRLSVCPCGNH